MSEVPLYMQEEAKRKVRGRSWTHTNNKNQNSAKPETDLVFGSGSNLFGFF